MKTVASALSCVVVAALAVAGCSSAQREDERVGVSEQALVSGFRLPFKCNASMTITQGNNSPFSHNGQSAYGFDFGVPLNTQLVATKAGKVTHAKNDVKPGNPCYSGGGPSCANTHNYVTIDHGDNTSTVYAHMNAVSVVVGAVVAQGQAIGLSGGTGYSTGAHTHLQRQTSCGAYYCQSVPMSFDDVAGNGVPGTGQSVKSANACSPNADCALGNGKYCGGNGVKGDTATLFQCTAAVAAVAEKCTYGCKVMPPGKDDRCNTASEAPVVDAGGGADGDADAALAMTDDEPPAIPATPAGVEGEASSAPPASPASAELEASGPESAESSCAIPRSMPGRSTIPMLAIAVAMALLWRRRAKA